MKEEELDMNDLIISFNEYSTDFTKTACKYYEEYLTNYQKEKIQLKNNWNELKEYLEKILEESCVPLRQYYAEHFLTIMQKIESRK